MDTLIILIRGCTLGIYCILSLKLYLDCRQYLAGRLLLCLILCGGVYLVEPYVPASNWLEIITRALASLVTPLYWLFTASLINDWDYQQRGVGKKRMLITASYLIVILLALALHYGFPGRFEPSKVVLYYLSYFYRLAFLGIALIAALSSWRQDLVEARRRLRLLIVGIGVVTTLFITLLEVGYGGAAQPLGLMLMNASLLMFLSLGLSLWLLFITPDGITASVGSPATVHQAN